MKLLLKVVVVLHFFQNEKKRNEKQVDCAKRSQMKIGMLREFLKYPSLEPCPDDGCANTTCPTGLVRHSCAPCPVSCAHISSGTSCDAKAPCYSGQSTGKEIVIHC